MTPRFLARIRRVAVGLAAVSGFLALMPGCDPRQAMYFLQPYEQTIPGGCPSLSGKRVVVLTMTVPGSSSDTIGIDAEITDKLVAILKREVKKIDVVEPGKVRDWARNKPSLTDPADAARAFEADVVIYLEIRKFQIQNPQDLQMLSGESDISIQVTELKYPKDDRGHPMKDKPKESELIHDENETTKFPITGGRPIEVGTSKTMFKRAFTKLVVDEISWHFVPHAPGDDIQDTRVKD